MGAKEKGCRKYISSARLTPRRLCLGYETDSKRMVDDFAFLGGISTTNSRNLYYTQRRGSEGIEKESKDDSHDTPLMACIVSGTSVRNSTYEGSAQSSDSCATTHVCNNRRRLLNFRPAEEGEHLSNHREFNRRHRAPQRGFRTYLPSIQVSCLIYDRVMKDGQKGSHDKGWPLL
jgi:hypothetical protein